MKIDKKLETPMGDVHFVGEISEEELEYVIEAGLLSLMLRGELRTQVQDPEGNIVPFNMDGETLQ